MDGVRTVTLSVMHPAEFLRLLGARHSATSLKATTEPSTSAWRVDSDFRVMGRDGVLRSKIFAVSADRPVPL